MSGNAGTDLHALAATMNAASQQIHQRSQEKVREDARGVESSANAGSDTLGVGAITTYGNNSATVSTVQPIPAQRQDGTRAPAVNTAATAQHLGGQLATLGASLVTK